MTSTLLASSFARRVARDIALARTLQRKAAIARYVRARFPCWFVTRVSVYLVAFAQDQTLARNHRN